ncbi:protein FAM186A [Tiliqua scincoides]|uniref:protein FAM186A n=1 Tax=Tiliqua scincoides TaxID=71010 RepID=UPI003461C15C
MNIQKFVAWDKLQSLVPKPDESSSSASHSGSEDEHEDDFNEKFKNIIPKVNSYTPTIEVPATVKNVLVKLDTAQLERAKKEISKKLFRILDNVNQTYERYKKVDDFDPALEKEYLLTPTWQEKNRRSRLLDDVDDVLDESVYKVHELKMVLESLKAWHGTLTKVEQQKEDICTAAQIDEMGESMLKLIDSINTNVQHLFKICHSFSEQKTKLRRKSAPRVSVFKLWKEKVAEHPKEGEPMTPEQMLENEPLAFTRNQEVTHLIQELADSSIFNKAECVAIKYILNMMLNLMKAFSTLTRQCRSLKVKCENLEVLEKKKPDLQISQLQRELHIVMEKKAVLEIQVQAAEDKCKVLTTANEILQKELHDTHEKVLMTKAPVCLSSSEKAIAKPQADVSKNKDEKPLLKVSSKHQTLSTVKNEEKPCLEEKQEPGPKPEESVEEKLPATISETEVLQKHLVPQAQDSKMKVYTKLQGKDTSPKQVSSDKLEAKLSQKDISLKSSGQITSDATTTGDMQPLDTEPAQEGSAEKARRPSEKIKAIQDSKGDSKLEGRRKLQKLQIRRSTRSKEKDLVSPQTLEESPSPSLYDTSSGEEPSPSTSRESARIPSSTKFIGPPEGLPDQPVAVQPLPEQPIAVSHASIHGGEVTLPDKLTLKLVSQRIVEDIRKKKTVKFQDEVLVPKPVTTPETGEIQVTEVPDTRLSQQPVLEGVKDTAAEKQDAAETQAQEFLVGELKEIQEKKEIMGFGRMLAHVPHPKPPESAGNIIHGLGAKLQELARKKGGVLDAETIKEFFEELAITHQETIPGQLVESQPRDRIIPRIPLGKRPTLPLSATIQAFKKEKPRLGAVEEEPSREDVGIVLQEFQAAILASLEDKMVKFKKGSPTGWKQPVKFQPTDPQVKHVFRIVDRKLDECFSLMKQRYLGGLKRQRFPESTSSKGALSEGEEKAVKITDSSSLEISLRLSKESSSSSFSLSGEWEQPSEHTLHAKSRKQQSSEHEEEPEQMRRVEEKPQDQVEGGPKLREEKISSDEEEDEQFLVAHQPDKVDEEELVDQEWQEGEHKEARLLSEAQVKHIPKGKGLQQMETVPEEAQGKDEEEQAWYMQLQERLMEEQARLLEERQRLDEEAQYLDHMQELFEVQLNQWKEQQQQREEQERLWQVQLAHWQELQQEQEAQEQYWEAQREKQKEQQAQLQGEVDRLEQLHREHLQRQGEEAKEEWQWKQLKAMHREQQRLWQAEDEEQAVKRWEWQQQLADHEERMEALRQNYLEQEQKQKLWLQEQQEAQKEQEHLWEKRWLGQLKRWRRQLQQQRAQQRSLLSLLEKGRKLKERQQVRQVSKEGKPQPCVVKMVQGTALEQFPLQQKVALLHKDSQVPVTPQLTPRPSIEFEESSCDLDRSWFPKLFRKAEMFHAPAITERRYCLDVSAQNKNLELLKEALQKSELSSDDYNKAKGMIRQALQGNVERLAMLFRKYIIFCHLQDARQKLTAQLDIAKYAKDGAKMKDLYKMVEKLDAYSKVVLGKWKVKQVAMEKKHQRCLEKMIAFFAQLRLMTKLPLSSPCPLLIKAVDSTKETISMPHIGAVLLKSKVSPSPLVTVKKPQDFPYSAAVREPSSEQIESLWKTDITELSIPIGPKTPVSLLWSEACGHPDIPRLLELDISSVRNKSLQDVKTRIQHIPRWKITGYNFMHL